MANHKRSYQHARPVLVSAQGISARPLERVSLTPASQASGEKYSEAWLQSLLHQHPETLPIVELEPGLGRIIPVGMELQTPAGYVDNLFVTTQGDLVVVECKLWRNPEARRLVLAQIIDYAQSIQKWRYDDLDRAVQKSFGPDGNPIGRSLLDVVRGSHDPDEIDQAAFVDAVQKNLRLGRMLLLVVGDGIREDAESLAGFLQQHAGFHFTLGLVETAVYKLPNEELLVQPRVLVRTLNIERTIVSMAEGLVAEQVVIGEKQTSRRPTGMSLTEETFFEKLRQTQTAVADALSAFLNLERTNELGLFLDVATKSASVKWESSSGKVYNLGGVDLQGKLSTYSVCWAPSSIGRVDIGHAYLNHLSNLTGGTVRQTKTSDQWYVVMSGTVSPSALEILRKPNEWLDAIALFQIEINKIERDTVTA